MRRIKKIALFVCFAFFSSLGGAAAHDCDQCRDLIGPSIHGSTGKWLDQSVPHRNWSCTGIEDLGDPNQTCEMCEREQIRYVHHMAHNNYDQELEVGCICVGHMEGDLAAAQERDRSLKSRTQRRAEWLERQWKISAKGNDYLKTRKIGGDISHHIVLTKSRFNNFSASVDGKFLDKWYKTKDEAKLAAFDSIWPAKINY